MERFIYYILQYIFMKKGLILVGLVFILGWLANGVYSENVENPFMVSPRELTSPSDIIKEGQIEIFKDKIVIYISNASWSKYADTKSMDPLLDKGANGLQIVPDSTGDINIGDVITYDPEWTNKLIVHRVVYVGEDDSGWYCVTKGDNSTRTDPGKVRFDDVSFLLVGVLY